MQKCEARREKKKEKRAKKLTKQTFSRAQLSQHNSLFMTSIMFARGRYTNGLTHTLTHTRRHAHTLGLNGRSEAHLTLYRHAWAGRRQLPQRCASWHATHLSSPSIEQRHSDRDGEREGERESETAHKLRCGHLSLLIRLSTKVQKQRAP